MIRYKVKTNTTPLLNAQRTLDNIHAEIAAIGYQVIEETRPALMAELQYTPPKRSYPDEYPIEFKPLPSLQRPAFFASDGFDGGIPTQRTGALIAAFEIYGEETTQGFNAIVANTKPWSKFVIGSLAKRISDAARFQQKFHAITGWKLATVPVQAWHKKIRGLITRRFQRRMQTITTVSVTGRAYTTPRRK